MKICVQNSPVFQRRLKTSEEADYSDVLKQAKSKVSGFDSGRSILIIPASSLPQSAQNNTGVGNLASTDGQKFIDFAKKYWGINEIQLLPVGQYYNSDDVYKLYSGTSMDLGNHMINLTDFFTVDEIKQVIKSNNITDRVNFSNIVDKNSTSEKLLKNLYNNLSTAMKQEFEVYKTENAEILDRKGIFKALTELNGTFDYHRWNHLDNNLFNEDIVSKTEREKRITEIESLKTETIDFFKFKNFLADKSLKKAKQELNSKGIKLNGDMPCKFADEEVWAYPKAFLKDTKLFEWNFPVLDISSPEAEVVLREKVRMYAKRFDGFRVDASWTYVTPNIYNLVTKKQGKLDNGDFFLNIIDDEVRRIKGANYNLNNIMHEFAANPGLQFSVYSSGGSLKPLVIDRVKIYTSDHLSDDWGSAEIFLERRWTEDKFIIGATNHDSMPMEPTEKQIRVLSKILKIEPEKLKNKTEFIKAKFAEPLRTKNNMLFFLNALGIHERFKNNSERKFDWARKTPENYEEVYFESLRKGTAFNPMDALEKQFIAQGLDKTEPELFKKILKYKKLLLQKESSSLWLKISAVVSIVVLVGICLNKLNTDKQRQEKSYSSK